MDRRPLQTAILTALGLALATASLAAPPSMLPQPRPPIPASPATLQKSASDDRPSLFEHHCHNPGEDPGVDITIEALKDAVKQADCQKAYQALLKATWLDIYHLELKDLRVLNDFSQIRSLTLRGSQELDLSVLSGLPNLSLLTISSPVSEFNYPGTGLDRLTFMANSNVSFSAPKNLASLSELYLEHSSLADSRMLSELKGLRDLRIIGGNLRSVAPLAGLPQLAQLILEYNPVADISPLSQIESLRVVSLSGSQVKDIAPLAKLNLKRLRISDIPLADPKQLALFTGLESLAISGLGLQSLDFLQDCEGLENLVASRNALRSVSSLSGCPMLRNLDLSHNAISEFGADGKAEAFVSLINLNLSHNQLEDIAFVPKRIFDLDLSHNPLVSLGAFSRAPRPELYRLTISKTKITDLGPLRGLPGLVELVMDENELASLAGIEQATKLRKVSAAFGRISSLSPLASLRQLRSLDLLVNDIRDASPLAGLKNMVALDLFGNPLGDTVAKTPENCPTASANAALNTWCGYSRSSP